MLPLSSDASISSTHLGSGDALRFESGNGGQRAEGGVAVVRRTPPIKLAVAQHRLPGAETRQPAGEFRLLVEVAIKEDRARKLARDIDQQHGRAAWKPADLDAHAGNRLGAAPVGHELHGGVHVSVGFPLRDRTWAICSECARRR